MQFCVEGVVKELKRGLFRVGLLVVYRSGFE